MKICFVCTGNICRSPMAEIIFQNLCRKNKCTDIEVYSAGTRVAVGTVISKESQIALRDCREKLPKVLPHARQFTPDMFALYDHIICMTGGHKLELCAYGRVPALNNVRTLHEWVGCGDIADPYGNGTDRYFEVCKILQSALKLLYKEITKLEGVCV